MSDREMSRTLQMENNYFSKACLDISEEEQSYHSLETNIRSPIMYTEQFRR